MSKLVLARSPQDLVAIVYQNFPGRLPEWHSLHFSHFQALYHHHGPIITFDRLICCFSCFPPSSSSTGNSLVSLSIGSLYSLFPRLRAKLNSIFWAVPLTLSPFLASLMFLKCTFIILCSLRDSYDFKWKIWQKLAPVREQKVRRNEGEQNVLIFQKARVWWSFHPCETLQLSRSTEITYLGTSLLQLQTTSLKKSNQLASTHKNRRLKTRLVVEICCSFSQRWATSFPIHKAPSLLSIHAELGHQAAGAKLSKYHFVVVADFHPSIWCVSWIAFVLPIILGFNWTRNFPIPLKDCTGNFVTSNCTSCQHKHNLCWLMMVGCSSSKLDCKRYKLPISPM